MIYNKSIFLDNEMKRIRKRMMIEKENAISARAMTKESSMNA